MNLSEARKVVRDFAKIFRAVERIEEACEAAASAEEELSRFESRKASEIGRAHV